MHVHIPWINVRDYWQEFNLPIFYDSLNPQIKSPRQIFPIYSVQGTRPSSGFVRVRVHVYCVHNIRGRMCSICHAKLIAFL